MLFTKNYVAARVAKAQLDEVNKQRTMSNFAEKGFNPIYESAGLAVNSGLVPQDIYQEFDRQTVERMRSDDGDVFLNDLMGLSKAVSVGRLTHVQRMASGAGLVSTSMNGQQGIKMDQVDYKYNGSIIPVHDTGFFRSWRELEAGRAEDFDALIDDQRESVASLRKHLAQSVLDGHKDAAGNYIVVDGRQWQGVRNDSRVQAVDLGAGGVNFNFTLNTNSGADIKKAFITTMNFLYITNNCVKDVTVYVSKEIGRNFERAFSDNYNSDKIIDELAGLQGIASIKVSNLLSGNELFATALDGTGIRPITGMGIATMALPRSMYNSNHEFVTAAAIGMHVSNDYDGQTCTLYAQG